MEQRAVPRERILMPVTYLVNEEPEKGYMTDLSEKGCRLTVYRKNPLVQGTILELILASSRFSEPLQVKSRVAWIHEFLPPMEQARGVEINYELGIEFVWLAEGDRRSIQRIMKEIRPLKDSGD